MPRIGWNNREGIRRRRKLEFGGHHQGRGEEELNGHRASKLATKSENKKGSIWSEISPGGVNISLRSDTRNHYPISFTDFPN
jgi:hypothetical protein